MSARVLLSLAASLLVSQAATAEWTRFRGPDGAGVSDGPAVPYEWSSDQNLAWRAELPGSGSSSPIVAGGNVYVTCYTGYGLDPTAPGDAADLVRHLVAIDRETGAELWRFSEASASEEDPYQGFIIQHGYASSTPAADAERVYAVLGKSGLFAFTHAGEEVWRAELGERSDPNEWGDGSSPIVVGGRVIVNAGILGNALVAFDAETGAEAWRVEDPEFTSTWSTPTSVTIDGRTLALFNVPRQLIAVDVQSGEVAWRVDSPIDGSACASIVLADGAAFAMGSREGRGIGVSLTDRSDAGEPDVLWSRSIRSSIITPVALDGALYWASRGRVLAARVSDGEYVYRTRLPRKGGATGGFPNADYSSPVASGGNLILFTRNGESYVIRPGDELDVIAHNPPFDGDDSSFSGTPAIDAGRLFVRSERYLYCIGRP